MKNIKQILKIKKLYSQYLFIDSSFSSNTKLYEVPRSSFLYKRIVTRTIYNNLVGVGVDRDVGHK